MTVERLEPRFVLNAAPVLDPTASPELSPVLEGSGIPVGDVGTLVSNLIDSGGPLNNFFDADGDSPGIAITGVNLQGGALWYSVNGGVTWRPLGSVSDSSPRLLTANPSTRVYYQPAADFSGAVADVLSFKAWDAYAFLQQLGGDIDGEAAYDYSGRSVSLSADGQTVAVGATGNDGNGPSSGHVRLYRWSGTAWEQIGGDINGEAAGDSSGSSVSLSADGQTVAIGATGNDGNGTDSGHVRLYRWSGSTWEQLGGDIDGEAADDESGVSVSLSADGQTVAVGAPSNDGKGNRSGHVRLYRWSGAAWQQLGSDIDGKAAGDNSGYSVSLSADGQTVAIGALYNNGKYSSPGYVRLYRWSGTAWQQIGRDINGEAAYDYSGDSVSLSADGQTIAVGASGNDGNGSDSGHVRLYRWTGTAWQQVGSDIDGEAADDGSGARVSLSADGQTIAIGAPYNDGTGADSGHARLYRWSGSAWEQLGGDIDGEAVGDRSGGSVSLSADGQTVAIGATGNDGNGSSSGHVRLYRWISLPSAFSVVTDTVSTVVISLPNTGPSGVSLTDVVSSLPEGFDTTARTKVALINVHDDGRGTNTLSLSGTNVDSFEVDGSELFLKAGVELDYETRASYSVTIEASDATVVGSAPVTADFVLTITNVNETPSEVVITNAVTSLAEDTDTATPNKVGDISITDDALGVNTVSLVGPDASSFEINGSELFLKAGVVLDYEAKASYSVTVRVHDPTIFGSAPVTANLVLTIREVNAAPVLDPTASPELSPVLEGSGIPVGDVGTLVSNLIDSGGPLNNFFDADGDSPGIAITGVNLQGGALWYSVNGGVTWSPLGSVSDSSPRLLTANPSARVYYQPAADFSGTVADVLTFKAWDAFAFLQQLGGDIDGEAAGDRLGWSVSLSADGQTVAIGAYLNDGNGADSGHVRLYRWSGTAWEQLGGDIDGEAAGDESGWSISLSADGQTVAIGAMLNDGNGISSGHVRLYRWSGSTWEQLGGDIDGEAADDGSGNSVSLSADGQTVAIGAVYNDGNGSSSGQVRLYRWSGSAWEQLGSDIDGEAPEDNSGAWVSLSSDGQMVAIGAHGNDGNGASSGHVRLYRWSGSEWDQLGGDIDGEAVGDRAGLSISLSSDGQTVAIGARWNDGNGADSGHVRLYRWNGSVWQQLGGDIDGEAAYDYSGRSVSLSADGQTVAVGATGNDGTWTSSGHVRLYRWSGTAWEQLAGDIDGEAAGDGSGNSVSLSADGQTVVIGASYNDGNGTSSGHVRGYRVNVPSSAFSIATDTVSVEVLLPNAAPSGVSLKDVVSSLPEDFDTTARTKLASIDVQDDGRGTNSLSLAGQDASNFEIDGTELYLRAGVVLDYETRASYSLTVEASDATVVGSAPVTTDFELTITNVNEAPVLDPTASPELALVGRDAGIPVGEVGTLVSHLIDAGGPLNNFSDADGDSPGIAITGVNLQGGALWYSVNNGVTWSLLGAVSDSSPRLFSASPLTRVYYQPAADFTGTVSDLLTFKAWDSYAFLQQLGGDIDGEAGGDESGWSVSLSADGQTVAIGARFSDGVAHGDGHVRLYRWSGTAWQQLGGDIDGEAAFDESGWSISLSADGQTIAIGAPYNDGKGNASGHVRLYRWNGTAWQQLGGDIDGVAAGDMSGVAVSLSADGQIVAIGARFSDGNGPRSGHVRLYRWSGKAWHKLGGDIAGETAYDESGLSVSLSADGQTVAIGAPFNDGNGSDSGHVRLYRWRGTEWEQLGSDIDGVATGDESGYSVGLSADGQTVAIGAPGNDDNGSRSGHVCLYRWSGTAWEQLSGHIDGNAAGDESGWSVALSWAGQTVAIGAPGNDANGSNSGHVRLYRWSGSAWEQFGGSIDGEAAEDGSGNAVSLSADGQTVAIGAPLNDGNGGRSGHVRVYRWSAPSSALSQATDSVSVIVDVNAAPVLDPTASPELAPVLMDSGIPVGEVGTLVSNLIDAGGPLNNFSDADSDSPGIAITGVNLQGGALWYSVNNGVTWSPLGPVSDSSPRLLAANSLSRVYYQPAAGFTGTVADLLSFKAWDAYAFLQALGGSIDGEAGADRSGHSVALSADGQTVAIGATGSNGNGSDSGHVRLYRWSGSAWEQLGGDIDGEAAGDESGWSVSLSADGQTVAIGAPLNDGNRTSSGHVRLYRWSGTAWEQLGDDIDGEAAFNESGWSVSLSADGQTVATAAHYNDGDGTDSGHVRLYRWSGTTWQQLGGDIDGEAAYDRFGYSVSLSADGQTVAIGADSNDGAGSNSGHVRLYSWSGSVWEQLGGDINGQATGDGSGVSVSLSADGQTVAIGAPGNDGAGANSGHVRLYRWSGSVWEQLGDDIDGEAAGDISGVSVSLSADGQTVAIGARWNDGNGVDSGHVRLYRWSGSAWEQLDGDIDGAAAGDELGWSVAVSADAQSVAMGAPFNDGDAADSGQVRLYRWTSRSSAFSVASDTVSVEVGVNAAPVLDPTASPELTAVLRDSGIPVGEVGTLVSLLIDQDGPLNNFSDADSDTPGIAITGVNLLGGALWYSVNNGVTWSPVGTVSNSSSRLLTANPLTRVYYQPAPGFTGTVADLLTFKAWDAYAFLKQLGGDIDGEAADDRSGYSVALSADGETVAIGARWNDGNGANSGQVRLYQWSGTAWEQLGGDIEGEAPGDESGWSISLSADGQTVAIGAPLNDGSGADSGQVRLYRWSGTAWQQLGGDIDGEAAGDMSGVSVSLSADGQTVAIGTPLNDGNGADSGQVRVYRWSGTAWQQLGGDIEGEAAGDYSGGSVSLSADAQTVAIGARWNDGNGPDAGHVRVYRLSGTAWRQLGGDIDGEAAGDYSGGSVSLSADAQTVVIGAYGNDGNGADSGHVRVYRWSGTAWQQLGGDIDGEAVGDVSGLSVALSADGHTVAIGAPINDGNGTASGHVRLYSWSGTAWRQLGGGIDGEAAGDISGWSVALSADGRAVATGAYYNDGNGADSGHVRVHHWIARSSAFSLASDTASVTVHPVVDVAAGGTVTDTNVYSGDVTLVKTGDGTLILNQSNSHTGGLRIEAGTVILQNINALNGGPLVVLAGARVAIDTGTALVPLSSLEADLTAAIDVGSAGFTVQSSGYVERAIRQLLIAGCNSGQWNGTSGIRHSSLAAARAVGYGVDANGKLTVRQTMAGDVDIDGDVDFDDILGLFPNYGTIAGMVWSGGDITYDDAVDFDDILALFPNYGNSSAFGAGLLGSGGSGGGTSMTSAASEGAATPDASVVGPMPPADLPLQTPTTLYRSSDLSEMNVTSLAFAALAGQVKGKPSGNAIDDFWPGVSSGLGGRL